jgi:hypothetical protein
MKTGKAGRPRNKVNRHLPHRVYIHHGSYWYRPKNGLPRKLVRVGDCDPNDLPAMCVEVPGDKIIRPVVVKKPLRMRLMEHVRKAEECWHWTGSKNNDGYGQVHIGRKTLLAHRLSYESFVGPVPAGLQLDHLCRNRACINPAHLEAVTGSVNVQRRYDARVRSIAEL